MSQPSRRFFQQSPFIPMENIQNTHTAPIKTPLKTRAISSHMPHKQTNYSQPCSTIVYSPVKNPLTIASDLRNYHQTNTFEEKEFVYRLQNEKMSQILKEKELILFELRGKLKEFEAFKEEKEQNSMALNNLEKKINDVLCENQRLNVLLQEKGDSLHLSQHLEENVKELLSENSKLNELSVKNQGNIEKYKRNLQDLSEENERINGLYEEKLRESEVFNELIRKSEALIIENEKLNASNRFQQKELEHWKQKFLQLEKMLNSFLLQEKNNGGKEENMEKLKDYESIVNENIGLKEKITGIEGKLMLLTDENKKLNEFFKVYCHEQEENLEKKQKEIENLKENKEDLLKSLREKELEANNFEKIKENFNVLINENNKLNKMFNEKVISPRRNDYQKQMVELQDKLEIMIEENEKLNAVIEEKSNELENASKVEEFLKINDKLNRALNEKKQEADFWKRKFQEMQK